MKTKSEKNDAYLLSSVNNALKILELLLVRDNIRLKDITELLGLNRTSVFKMLYTLEHRGFVIKDLHAHYHLGNRLIVYQQLSAHWRKIADLAAPYIFQLYARTKKTVLLGVVGTDDRLQIIEMKAERGQDSIVARVGGAMDNHTSAIGKILLAYQEPEIREAIVGRSRLIKRTEYTITDRKEFLKCLEDCQKRNWAVCYEENHLDHCDIAAPVFDFSATCVAALCIVTDRKSMDEFLPAYRSDLLDAAFRISEQLGYKTYAKT